MTHQKNTGGQKGNERLIHHIVVMWDESEHLTQRKAEPLSNVFYKHYLKVFPQGGKTAESPHVIYTGSPILNLEKVRKFLHRGEFISMEGKNKDLAIVKYCSTGLIDQDEKSHFLLDELRYMRDVRSEPPMHSDSSTIVYFVTSDHGQGMLEALQYVGSERTATRTTFMASQIRKSLMVGDMRIAYAAGTLGHALASRFVRHENRGLVLKIETQGLHSPLPNQ